MKRLPLESPTPLARLLEALALAHAALLPISIAASQIWAYLMAPVAVYGWYSGAFGSYARPPLRWPIALFVAAVLLSIVFGIRPEHSLRKADRLLLFASALVLPMLSGGPAAPAPRLPLRCAVLFLCGCAAKAMYDLVRIPAKYIWALQTTPADQLSLYAFGNMRDPQFYAVALCALVSLLAHRHAGPHRKWVLAALIACAAAIILHFKRGAWLSLFVALIAWTTLSKRWRFLFALLAAIAALLAFPATRTRLIQLGEEANISLGGRRSLWTRVAPALYREYPLGIGWRAARHADLAETAFPVQPRLNHLHNNLLHIRLELGWPGVLAWSFLALSGFWVFFRGISRLRNLALERGGGDVNGPALAEGLLAGYFALQMNGMVEYNFGDGEIFMLMNLLLGLGSAWAVTSVEASRQTAKA